MTIFLSKLQANYRQFKYSGTAARPRAYKRRAYRLAPASAHSLRRVCWLILPKHSIRPGTALLRSCSPCAHRSGVRSRMPSTHSLRRVCWLILPKHSTARCWFSFPPRPRTP